MIIGDQRPHHESLPDFETSIGKEVIELAASTGLNLDDWQQYALHNAMGINDNGKWSAFEVLLIVSRQNGKGSILEARELAALYLIPSDRLALHTAHEHKTSAEHYLRIRSLIRNNSELERKIRRESQAYGREFIELVPSPTIIIGASGNLVRIGGSHRLLFIARSGGSGRGFTADYLGYDEVMILDANKVSASMPALFARPNPQIWYAGSAGMKTSTQQAAVRRRGMNKENPSPSLAFMEWSINPHNEYCKPGCKLHDDRESMESVAKANPGLGIRIMPDMIEKAREAFSEDPEGYDREVLGVGQYPVSEDAWLIISKSKWLAMTDHTESPERFRRPVFAVSVSPDRSYGCVAVSGIRGDGSTGVQIIEYAHGTNWIPQRMKDIAERWGRIRWVIDPHGAAGSLISDLELMGMKIELVNATDVAHASGNFYDGTVNGWLYHFDQKPLTKAVSGVDIRPLSGQWAWDWKNSASDITSLVAATLALWGHMKFGKSGNYEIAKTVHFNTREIIRMVKAGVYGTEDLIRLKNRGLLDGQAIADLKDAGIGVPDSDNN